MKLRARVCKLDLHTRARMVCTLMKLRSFIMEWRIHQFKVPLYIRFGCCSETKSQLQTFVDNDLFDLDVEYQ